MSACRAARGPATAVPAVAALLVAAVVAAAAAAPSLAGDALAQSAYDPPLKQHERVLAQAVVCNDGLDLVIKSSDGSPACVGTEARQALLARGWATEPPDVPRAPSIDLTDDERAWLAANPIRMSYDPYWPPFEFTNADGEFDGLAAAYRAELERLIGTDFVLVQSPDWPGALDAVRAGEVDVLPTTGDTPDRREFMGFAPPYMTLSTAMITLDGEDVSADDLAAKKVGTIRGYEVEDWLDENRPDVAYIPLDEALAFAALQAGDIDVLLWFWEIADYKAQMAGVDGLYNAGDVGHMMDVSVAYALADPTLGAIIEKAMDAIADVDQARMLNEAVMARPPPEMIAADSMAIAAPVDGAPADIPPLDLSASEKAWLASGPKIRVAYDPDWPPIEFDMDGEVAGLSAAYMQLAAAMTGAEFVPVPRDDWSGALAAVRSGEADVIFSLARTADREEFLGFTAPHTVLTWHIIAASARAIEAEDLGTIRVGTIRDYSIEEWLEANRPDVRFTSYPDYGELLGALRSGEIEAFVEVWPVAAMRAGMAGMEVHRAGELGESLALSAGYAKSNMVLGSIMEKAVAAIPDDLRDEAAAGLVPPPAAPGPALALTAAEEAWIADNPVVRVAYDPDFAPFEYIDGAGELGGPSRAYMDRFADLMGVSFELIEAGTWSESLEAMRTGDADVMFMVAVTEERREFMGFTEPHTVLTWDMITRGDAGMVTAEGLEDLRVGAVRDYAVVAWLEANMPEVRVTEFDSHAAAFTAMASGEIDVLVDTWASSVHAAGAAGITDLANAGPVGATLDLAVAYSRNNNAALGSILAKALAEVPSSERERLASMMPGPGQGPAASTAAGDGTAPFALTDEESAWAAGNPTVRVAYDPDAAPFESIGEGGGLEGLARLYMDRLANMTGLGFELIEAATWTESLEAMRSGDADVVFIALVTEERREYMTFTEPHTRLPWDMLTLGPDGRTNLTAADLPGLEVGAIRDYAIFGQAAEAMPDVNIVPYDSHADAFDALESGDLDVFIESWTSVLPAAAEYGAADDLNYAGSLDFAAEMRIAYSNEADPVLGQIIERAFSAIPDAEKQEWQARTLVPPPSSPPPPPPPS